MTTDPTMKTYAGIFDVAGPGRVFVHDGTRHTEGSTAECLKYLTEHTRHSPDGYSWGYLGSGPAQLALDLLWDVLGVEPEPAMYQAFKNDVVARWPGRDDWKMTEDQIRSWIIEYNTADHDR